MVKKLTN